MKINYTKLAITFLITGLTGGFIGTLGLGTTGCVMSFFAGCAITLVSINHFGTIEY